MNLHGIFPPIKHAYTSLWTEDEYNNTYNEEMGGDLEGTLAECWEENDRILGLWLNKDLDLAYIIYVIEFDNYPPDRERAKNGGMPSSRWWISLHHTLESRS